jgi:hypothetical protein
MNTPVVGTLGAASAAQAATCSPQEGYRVVLRNDAMVLSQRISGDSHHPDDIFYSYDVATTLCSMATGEAREIHSGPRGPGVPYDSIGGFVARGSFVAYTHQWGDRYDGQQEVVRTDVRNFEHWREYQGRLWVSEMKVNHRGDVAWIRPGRQRGRDVTRLMVRRGEAATQYAVARSIKNLRLSTSAVRWYASGRWHRRVLR